MSLRFNGYPVRTAYDALCALEILKNFVPDFAFIDLGLPAALN